MSLAGARGLYSITVTPFHEDGRIDEASLDRSTDFYAECGANGLTILGVMGEANKLEATEARAVAQRVIRRTDRPVIVGVSSPNLAQMGRLAREVMDQGAAGVMIAPPPNLRTDDQIVRYYGEALASVGHDVPVAIQDYPLLFTVQMTPKVIRTLVETYPSCTMLKHEDWPGLEKISALRDFEEDGTMPRISILAGNGGVFLDFELARGADGAMTGYAFPDMLAELCELGTRGDREAAHDLFDAHLPMMRYEQQPGVGLGVRKYVLEKRGVIASSAQRAPKSPLSSGAAAEVDYLLKRLARHDPRAEF